jgi:hypothetical protein
MKIANFDRDSLVLSSLGVLAIVYLAFSGYLALPVVGVAVTVRLAMGFTENRIDSVQIKFLLAALSITFLILIISALDIGLERQFVLLNIFGGMSLPSVLLPMFKKPKEPQQ